MEPAIPSGILVCEGVRAVAKSSLRRSEATASRWARGAISNSIEGDYAAALVAKVGRNDTGQDVYRSCDSPGKGALGC